MSSAKFIKWFFIGLVGLMAGAYGLFALYFSVFPATPPDMFHGVEPDLGIGPSEKVVTYIQSDMFLTETEYQVRVGISKRSSDQKYPWSYYFVEVAKRYDDKYYGEVFYPFFSRWIPGKQVSADLWKKDVTEIVVYEPTTREVIIDCGFTNFTCTLPPD